MTVGHTSAEHASEQLDLNLLRVLDALLTTRGVTRASQQLGMTQSGVSRALHRLRTHFDDPLLLRDGRRMVLTATAERLQTPVARILDETRRLFVAGTEFDAAQAQWTASVATASYGEHWLVPALAARIAKEAPGVDLRVVGTLGANADDLEQGRVDLAIEPAGALDAPDVMSRKLFTDDFRCVMRKGHPWSKRLTLKRFTKLEHILVAPTGTAGGPIDDRLAEMGLRRRVRVQVLSFTAPMPLIVNSDRVVTLPSHLAHDFATRWPVTVVKCPVELGTFSLHAFWSARRRTDPAHQWLRKMLYETAAGLSG